MKSVYKLYRDRLVGITGRSRSLYSKNISKKQAYNLGKIFEQDVKLAREFLDFLWGDLKRRYKLMTPTMLAAYIKNFYGPDVPREQIKRIIENETDAVKALKREVEGIEKETGRYELFVGYPFVEGSLSRDILIKAPLLLFPARINTENGLELELLKDEPVMLNKVFILAYAREMHVNTDELNWEFEQGKNLPSIAQIVSYLKENDIVLKYSTASAKKPVADIEKSKDVCRGDLEVKPYAVLGRFPLANSIYYDYNILEKKNLSSPALDALLKNKDIKTRGKRKSDDHHFDIHQLDYAQESAIEKINKNSNMVIYGPPGTGKSQTIANIISDSICKHKRVIVVSQKRAALDVVFNRLGELNSKAVLLPDPEKMKNEFYARVQAKHTQIMDSKPRFNPERYAKTSQEIAKELSELDVISDALYTVTPFGLSLQQMYTMSSSIGKNTQDDVIYQALKSSPIIRMRYPELSEAVRIITERGKAKVYYDHRVISENNPLVDYIKTDLDIHQLNKVRAFVNQLLSKEHVPFNISAYPYSRYMLAHNIENGQQDNIKPLADMITRTENPKLVRRMNAALFPLLWPLYPLYRYQFTSERKNVAKRLNIAGNAVKHYVNEFNLLNSVLEPEGLALVIDSIAYGNDKFLKKLLGTLDDYLAVRDMNLTMRNTGETERILLDFAMQNSKNRTEFYSVIKKILPIRIYHEVILEEKEKEQELSKTIIFNDLRHRITALKKEQRSDTRALALDNFNDDYKKLFNENSAESRNFLHQIGKQQKLWPIRRLVEHFEDYLLSMFPCWLLSPEAVSAILPLKADMFDMILFDEASQIFIESTIPAIYRAKCMVVSGDNKQLRPTSVFVKRYMGDDTYSSESLDDQAVLEVESLLDLATSRLPSTHLTYHYRSKHEELINFSNYAFYEGRLQIAPNITRNKNYLPIERVKVDGRWDNRRNVREAQAVVEIVRKLYRTKNRPTVGIVTFNVEQEELIEDLLEAEAAKNEAFKKAYLEETNRKENGEDISLFVKNLENVQGDERDVIIFSIAYAANAEGKVNAQFGTLSMAGGENRLNVAVTRAKEKIYLVTSVEPEEFATIDSVKNAGPKLLKKYLQYARAVSSRNTAQQKTILESMLFSPKSNEKPLGAFETLLKSELEKDGYTVDANLGNADYRMSLAIYDKELDRYVLGLECDYAAYSSSESTLERDVYRSNFLESRGWKVMRVWSRDWWLNRNGLIKNIEREIEKQRGKLNAAAKSAAPAQSYNKERITAFVPKDSNPADGWMRSVKTPKKSTAKKGK